MATELTVLFWKFLIQAIHSLPREYDGIEVALIIRQNGRFFTYRSVDHESWPPSMKEIVRLCRSDMLIYAKLQAASFIPNS
jgi:hypothetical protein